MVCFLEGRWQVAAKDFDGGQRARRSARGMLDALNFDRRELEDAELVIGELLTNALRYTDGPVQVTVDHRNELVRIEVVDEGGCFDPALVSGPTDDGGRGILIVKSIASELRVRPHDRGCAVTATLQSSCVTPAAGGSGERS